MLLKLVRTVPHKSAVPPVTEKAGFSGYSWWPRLHKVLLPSLELCVQFHGPRRVYQWEKGEKAQGTRGDIALRARAPGTKRGGY